MFFIASQGSQIAGSPLTEPNFSQSVFLHSQKIVEVDLWQDRRTVPFDAIRNPPIEPVGELEEQRMGSLSGIPGNAATRDTV